MLGSDPGEEDSKFEYADITKANMCRVRHLAMHGAMLKRLHRAFAAFFAGTVRVSGSNETH